MPEIAKYYGEFGGMFIPETLVPAVEAVAREFELAWSDPAFRRDYEYYLREYVGRPSPLYYAKNLSRRLQGARIMLKREDLNHTGAHKINNTIGQVLLAKRMGKGRVIAETGAGQHGVATATACSLLGLECVVYMGEEDVHRQQLNVFRMKLLGARVIAVHTGTKTLKDAINEALRDWVAHVDDTFYCFGTAAGTYPYPYLVRELQRIIGEEVKSQCLEKYGRLPDVLMAAVGGGSNAIGLFYPFLDEGGVKMYGVEAAGKGLNTGAHAASINRGRVGVFHGAKSYLLQDRNGQVLGTHSVSAGLDYPGVGPEHSYLNATGRVQYVAVTDEEALQAFQTLAAVEGIIPALESSHAVAYALKIAPGLDKDRLLVVNLSGRGDKDVETVAGLLKEDRK